MGDVSAEPSMEDILSSIKRIIAEDGGEPAPRPRRARPVQTRTADMDEDEVLELSEPAPAPPPSPAPAPAPQVAETADAILSPRTAEASRGSLDALSRLIVKPEVEGSDTLEGMVREMLRPMLRDWLDANLPELVEAMVAKEISRITGGR